MSSPKCPVMTWQMAQAPPGGFETKGTQELPSETRLWLHQGPRSQPRPRGTDGLDSLLKVTA